MRPEENHFAEKVIPLYATRRDSDLGGMPVPADEPGIPPAMVLNAERGIINTGTVHGGQHVTAIELTGHLDQGADGDA